MIMYRKGRADPVYAKRCIVGVPV